MIGLYATNVSETGISCGLNAIENGTIVYPLYFLTYLLACFNQSCYITVCIIVSIKRCMQTGMKQHEKKKKKCHNKSNRT